MPVYQTTNSPEQNLSLLAANPYPGRLLIMGFAGSGVAVQVYAIGGRSEDSRNRVLLLEDNIISTASYDKSKLVSHPELTIYDGMRRSGAAHIASNGDQTATIIQYLRSGQSFEEAMNSRTYEPDAPNFTPRISGFIDATSGASSKFGLSLIRKAPDSPETIRMFYTENSPEICLEPGVGYGLHTYLGNDDPLPSFDEPPFRLPLLADPEAMAHLIWKHLNADTRVAIAAKTIAPDGQTDFFIINSHVS